MEMILGNKRTLNNMDHQMERQKVAQSLYLHQEESLRF